MVTKTEIKNVTLKITDRYFETFGVYYEDSKLKFPLSEDIVIAVDLNAEYYQDQIGKALIHPLKITVDDTEHSLYYLIGRDIVNDLIHIQINDYITDDYLYPIIDSKTRLDPNDNRALNEIDYLSNNLDALKNCTIALASNLIKTYAPLPQDAIMAPDYKYIFVTQSFKNWCSDLAKYIDVWRYSYAPRAALNYGNIEQFIQETLGASDYDLTKIDVNVVQTQILNGLGVNR